MMGPTIRFATGAINETSPNTGMVRGNVAHCATSVRESGSARSAGTRSLSKVNVTYGAKTVMNSTLIAES